MRTQNAEKPQEVWLIFAVTSQEMLKRT